MDFDTYFCEKCGVYHSMHEKTGFHHVKENLEEWMMPAILKFGEVSAIYGAVTSGLNGLVEGTHQYVRDTEVFSILADKFSKSGIFNNPQSAKEWVELQLAHGNQTQVFNVLQGHGAGEVDWVLRQRGSISSLFERTDFIRDAHGHISSNTPGVDLETVNRLTGQIKEIQVKAPYVLKSPSELEEFIRRDILGNRNYSPDHTLVLPKELADKAKEMGLSNPIEVNGTIERNFDSAQKLQEKVFDGNASPTMLPSDVVAKIGQSAIIGGAVSMGISLITSAIAMKQGRMTARDAMKQIGKDGLKGAISGGALGGLSLVVPGGIIGFGIGILVGMPLRSCLDDAFGDGSYKEMVRATDSTYLMCRQLEDTNTVTAEVISYSDWVHHQLSNSMQSIQNGLNKRSDLLDRIKLSRAVIEGMK